MLINIKTKKSVAILGHSGLLNVYVDPKKFTLTLAFKSIPHKRLGIFA